MTRIPIACTITAAEVPDRVALMARLGRRLERVERTERRALLHFTPDGEVEADLRRFAVDEKQCCQFWELTVEAGASGLMLRWDGPPEAAALLDDLLALFAV